MLGLSGRLLCHSLVFGIDVFDKYRAEALHALLICVADTGTDNPIPLPNVTSKILAKVIEYCKYRVDSSKGSDDKPTVSDEEKKQWDLDFVKVDQATLFELILVRRLLSFGRTLLL